MESTFDLGGYSLFFTEEEATAPNAELSQSSVESASSSDPASSSSVMAYSSERLQTRIKTELEERMKGKSMNNRVAEIEASKSHWTEVSTDFYHTAAVDTQSDVKSVSESSVEATAQTITSKDNLSEDPSENILLEENQEEFLRLQTQDTVSDFFRDWSNELKMGEMFAEGGQGQIYEASVVASGKKRALKVFKSNMSLLELQKWWPSSVFGSKFHPQHEAFPGFLSPVLHGRLLEDGRFAFEMLRWWGDLRKLMDDRVKYSYIANGNQRHPFQMSNGKYLECCMFFMMWQIACGMEQLHKEGIVHRDLKAANVFIDLIHSKSKRFNPLQLDDHDFLCRIGDFECSIRTIGTAFWRAPEILKNLKDRQEYTTNIDDLFKVDVYSYGMTCYEILTGYIPFEKNKIACNNYDYILEGNRPELPRNLQPWIKELLTRCWHDDPSQRPTFDEISSFLIEELNKSIVECKVLRKYCNLHLDGY